ncbi:FAD-dependent oxidoreductase [Olleya namhaensis]|uniref:Flavin containing amine oxidoreductase n=1 Tax=Olleya namhaensis TaxID=1144750 RepID=A0A1I3R0X1_9FLAO|nr:FAD-dependent oxidoreductase [Olleya namhaensis]SFJ40193.1 Flavin containing amine oxidoreductase [Olleya namhaensis]
MNKQDYKIHIIGAGVSGLIASKVLEDNGYKSTIIEATDRVGGRVKTDTIDGYQLDHGFQVLLTAYPSAQKYLNIEALELQHFLPGATVFSNGSKKTIGDPLRNMTLLFPTLFSGIGTLQDKFKILKLNSLLKNAALTEIFDKTEQTTLQYLTDFGFSEDMITRFFKPFFSGIFLEPNLETSSRMFEFVYKMFGEGFAALPKDGIEAIPKQLKGNLKQTTFKFDTKVKSVEDGKIILEDNTELTSDFTIIATEASKLTGNNKQSKVKWKSCDTLYFETDIRVIDKPLIGLVVDNDALINNIFYHTSIPSNAVNKKELLSVTVVKTHGLNSESLIMRVKQELMQYCKIDTSTCLKHYAIAHALPKLEGLKYDMLPKDTKFSDRVFLAGDTQLNGSLNAAMLSGEKAALQIIQTIDGRL